jgi:Carboxypeptidase regulatory-like domain
VTDTTGAVVPNAQVVLTNTSLGTNRTVKTGGEGQYEFQFLAPGTYDLTVSAPGFRTYTRSSLQLLVNLPATVNVQLQVGQASQTVTVSAEAASVNTTDATVGNAVSNATIEALPMEGRNVPDLLSLQPGVVYLGRQVNQDTDSRSGAVAGVRSDQSDVTLDGVDNNTQTEGYAFTGVLRSTLDSVQEFRVTTSNTDANSGFSAGAQVVMVTKSGTNRFHGALYEYNRNTVTSANDWFNKQSELNSGLPNKPSPLSRNTFGGSLGGPIMHNRLFFFANYEAQRTAESQQVTRTVPTDSFRNGTLSYLDGSGNTVSLTPAQVQSMDPNCSSNGTCPWGPGGNPNVLALFSKYPEPNGFNSGDGLNTASYTFPGTAPQHLNTYIARIDWAASSHHHLFMRMNLQHDSLLGPPEFPGLPASTTQADHSGGLAIGDTWIISPTKINDFRYGFVDNKIANLGDEAGPYISFAGITSLNAETSSTIARIPVHNFVDDFTWIKGTHTIQVGANYLLINNDQNSNGTSFDSGSTGVGNLYAAAISGNGGSMDPAAFGFPAVGPRFQQSYDNDVTDLLGLISNVTDQANYRVAGSNASLLPSGAVIARDFRENEFEWYVQDTWRLRSNLTITYGVRHSLQQTPYEVNGQQVAPTNSMWDWFQTRAQQAALGNSVQPLITFAPSGQANGQKPYWPMNKLNFAPRVAIAYSPSASNGIIAKMFGGPGQSAIRAGFGIYYDHYGQGVVDSFSQFGSFGLSSSLSSPLNIWTVDNAPRFTAIDALPDVVAPAPATVSYPVTPSANAYGSGFAIAYGLDDRMKTPYSEAVDLSIQRQLPGGFMLELDYVGNFGHHLLQQLDLAAPVDLVDPKSGMDYYTAAKMLSEDALANNENPNATVAAIPWFEDLFPTAAGNGQSATQNIYTAGWYNRPGREVGAPYHLDVLCDWNVTLPSNCGNPSRFWNTQYSSLYSWASVGNSNYNAGQLILRHRMSHGLQLDFNFTHGRSFDLGSDAERSSVAAGTAHSPIIDAFRPSLNYAPSDFDTPNIISTDWVYELPFGSGKAFGSHVSGWLNAIIGGWRFSGLSRWTSGFPFSVIDGTGWSTNWDAQNWMVQTGPIPTNKHTLPNGATEVFADPTAIQNGIRPGGYPLRLSYAGEAGSRNAFRGDGVFDIDTGLEKTWTIHESQAVRFAWESFNVTNSVRFDTNSLQTNSTSGSLGVYSSLLTAPRVMQFSLRYSF